MDCDYYVEGLAPVTFSKKKQYSHARWEALCKSAYVKINQLSELKGGEYSGDDDRLANFRRNGERMGLLPEQIWQVYSAKHLDAVDQWIKDLATGKKRQRMESISGRIDDLLVYFLLLKAMVEEREEDQ